MRYDARCYFNVRSKSDISQLNLYRTEPTTKKWEKKLKSKNGYIGKQPGESVESLLKKKKKATVGRTCRKQKGFKPGMKDG